MEKLKLYNHPTEIQDKINELLTKALDKTNTGVETIAGTVGASALTSVNGNRTFIIKELGTVAAAELVSAKISAGASGIYKYYASTTSRETLILINFSSDNSTISGISLNGQYIQYFQNLTYLTSNFGNTTDTLLYTLPIAFYSTTSINDNLGGTPIYSTENSTLHIKGTFTPTATIASGSKLFSTGVPLGAKMTHGSAINTGSTGSESFVGISIQNNGDVYCLGALTAGTTYNIAVTATM